MPIGSEHRPGDLILDRYLPNADLETREQARANLEALAKVIVRIGIRQMREQQARRRAQAESSAGDPGGMIGPVT